MLQKNILILFILFFNNAFCQDNYLKKQEDAIKKQENLIIYSTEISDKLIANDSLIKLITQTISSPKAYMFPFDKLDYISVIQPKNRKFKLFTWFIPLENGTYNYFGILQTCKKNGRKCQIYQLHNRRKATEYTSKDLITYNNWYGCIYYDLIEIKVHKKKYYTLLGWDGHNNTSNKKIIDVLQIEKHNEPIFGAKIFNNNNSRMIIEYSEKYPISLKWDSEIQSIVFDHLEPIDGVSRDNFSLYVPNLSYDILEKSENGWQLKTNIYLNNSK